MLIRGIIILLLCCSGCRSGLLPCPEVKGLKLKKSQVNRGFRFPGRDVRKEEPEAVTTVSSDARTPTQRKSRKYRYVKYTIEHVDVEELDCPRPGEKRVMPRAIRENIRKNRKKIRYYYQEMATDTLQLLPGG